MTMPLFIMYIVLLCAFIALLKILDDRANKKWIKDMIDENKIWYKRIMEAAVKDDKLYNNKLLFESIIPFLMEQGLKIPEQITRFNDKIYWEIDNNTIKIYEAEKLLLTYTI